MSEVEALMEAFKEEAEVLLLFLRSVETIAAYTIDPTGESLLFSVNIAGVLCDLHERRRSFKASLEESFNKFHQCYGLRRSSPKAYTASR